MKYTIISNINIEHEIEADTEDQALEIHANEVELPKEYVSNSWELVKVIEQKDTAELCELAHEKTVQQCKKLNIILDKEPDEDGEIHYTDQAQEIFNKFFDELEDKYNH